MENPPDPYLRIRHWKKYQHYKNRNPPWIKLYTHLLDEPKFHRLDPAHRGYLMQIFMLAARFDNEVPTDLDWLAAKLGGTPDLSILSPWFASTTASKSASRNARPERETEGERETTGTSPIRRQKPTAGLTKSQFLSKREGTTAQALYGFFSAEYIRLYTIPYPDAPAPCVKLLKSVVHQTSASAARKALELYWEDIRRIQHSDWKGSNGQPPPSGGKPTPTVRAFVARLSRQMSDNGTGYQKLIQQDQKTEALAWTEQRGGLFP